jgi:hypothetical protein
MLTPPTPAHHRRADDWRRSDGGVWLPGAADVPRVAGDPMRGAGMTRRGMGFGFEPAGCCCEAGGIDCTHCTALDSEYDITLSGFSDTTYWTSQCGNNVATGCTGLNGTFRVAFTDQGLFAPYECYWRGLAGVVSIDRDTCIDYSRASAVFLEVTAGSSSGLIDVTVRVSVASDGLNQHFFIIEDIECVAGCLDGLELPASHSKGYWASPPYSVGACFDGQLTGSAMIDAVA